MSRSCDTVVIGAGLAGIAIALRLKKAGHDVVVLERSITYGGKLGQLSWNGYRWDKGPSLFTLPEQVDELFLLYGENPADHFQYLKMEESCHYYFNNGSDFLFRSDPDRRNTDLIAHFGEEQGKAVIAYLEESAKTYKNVGDIFIDKPKYGIKNILDKALLRRYPQLMTRKLMGSLDGHNRRRFKDQNLVQLFNRYGTYNGSDPYKMSGLYSMIAHLELNRGTFFPTNGMRSIVESLYDLAVKNGVRFEFNCAEISSRLKKEGFQTNFKDEVIHSKRLISAIDCVTFYKSVLKDNTTANKYAKKERSSSAIVFYWAVEKVIPKLKLHNIFFSADYRHEFAQIFDLNEIPDDPTIYLHISSVINTSDAPENGQNWFLMVNTPAGLVPNEEQKAEVKRLILKMMKKKFRIDIEPYIKHEMSWDAQGIEQDTGSYQGALYGASSNGKMAALTRHGNTSSKYPGLYFCGGTVHPGGGIPLVLKSSKIVAELIRKEK